MTSRAFQKFQRNLTAAGLPFGVQESTALALFDEYLRDFVREHCATEPETLARLIE